MKYLFKNKYWPVNKEYDIDKLLYLMIDRPNEIINYPINFIWLNHNKEVYRNYDLPADVISDDNLCSLFWFKNNTLYREKNNPVYIGSSGYKKYWINGKLIVK